MIRLVITAFFLIVFFIISLIMVPVCYFVGIFSKKLKDKISFAVVRFGFDTIRSISGVKLKVNGLENVPKDTSVLYVGNHRSFFDIVLAYPLCKCPTGFIAKVEISKVPVISWWMDLLHCLYIDRTDMRKALKTILKAIEEEKNGVSIFIFPEGTRNKGKEGSLLKFKEGSLRIASKSGCPVIPVAISGTRAVFEQQFPRIRPGEVTITYGEPIYISSLSGDDKKFPASLVQKKIESILNQD